MRGITITAAIMFALAGCSEAPTKDYYRQLSENVTMVMCGSEPEDRARALSEIVELTNGDGDRSEEHTSELQSLMRISYAVFCLTKKKRKHGKQQIRKRTINTN